MCTSLSTEDEGEPIYFTPSPAAFRSVSRGRKRPVYFQLMQSARRPVKTCWRSFCALWHSPGNGFDALPCRLLTIGTNRDRLRLMTMRHDTSYLAIAPSARKDTHLFSLRLASLPLSGLAYRELRSRFFKLRCSSSLDE